MQEIQFQSLGQEDSRRKKWEPTPVFYPGKSHGQRNMVGYSPWGYRRVRHDLTSSQEDWPSNLKHRSILGHRKICSASVGKHHDPLPKPGPQTVPLFAVASEEEPEFGFSESCQLSLWLEGVQKLLHAPRGTCGESLRVLAVKTLAGTAAMEIFKHQWEPEVKPIKKKMLEGCLEAMLKTREETASLLKQVLTSELGPMTRRCEGILHIITSISLWKENQNRVSIAKRAL